MIRLTGDGVDVDVGVDVDIDDELVDGALVAVADPGTGRKVGALSEAPAPLVMTAVGSELIDALTVTSGFAVSAGGVTSL